VRRVRSRRKEKGKESKGILVLSLTLLPRLLLPLLLFECVSNDRIGVICMGALGHRETGKRPEQSRESKTRSVSLEQAIESGGNRQTTTKKTTVSKNNTAKSLPLFLCSPLPSPFRSIRCSASSPPRPWARGPPRSSPRLPAEAGARFRRRRRLSSAPFAHRGRFPRRSSAPLLPA